MNQLGEPGGTQRAGSFPQPVVSSPSPPGAEVCAAPPAGPGSLGTARCPRYGVPVLAVHPDHPRCHCRCRGWLHKHTLKMWVWVPSDAHPIKTRAGMGTGRTTGTNAVPTHCYTLEKFSQGCVSPPDTSAPPQVLRDGPRAAVAKWGPRGFHRFSAACWQVGPISLGASRKSGETGAGSEGPGAAAAQGGGGRGGWSQGCRGAG